MDYILQAEKIDEMSALILKLNHYRDMYYNHDISEISDHEYDNLYDELVALEKETGITLKTSPTCNVGYLAVSELKKVKHNHPMLSLDKTKNINDVIKYFGNCDVDIMAKMDGLTCSLHYYNGVLLSAETRGDGEIGEDITHNALVIESIPKYIEDRGELIIDGELICKKSDFKEINDALPEEDRYKHIRNYASGSARQLDSKITASRKLTFVAWRIVEGCIETSFDKQIKYLGEQGFITVPIFSHLIMKENMLENAIKYMRNLCDEFEYPIDGCVFTHDNTILGNALGSTAHHRKDQIAFKFYDDTVDSTLLSVDWTMGKSGVLTPTAIFKPIEIDGTTISRASLHNISIMKTLDVKIGCTVSVYKANQIIPQIDACECQPENTIIEIPHTCPVCGGRTEVRKDNNTEILVCLNPSCSGKLLAKMVNFVSRKCANVVGLSEATLQDFINRGYIKSFKDIYHLNDYADEIRKIDGFGDRSVDKLLEAIETSRHIKLENFIASLGIDGIGNTNAKTIAQKFDNNCDKFFEALKSFDFSEIEGFGSSINVSIHRWYKDYCENKNNIACGIKDEFIFDNTENKKIINESLKGIKFCITGSFSKSRDELKEMLENCGATFVSGVSKNLDILFVGDNAGSKLNKAKELNIKIVYEDELFKMLRINDNSKNINTPAEIINNNKKVSENPEQITLW